MRVKDVAQRLDVRVGTVSALVASGELRCHRVVIGRGTIRVSEGHLAEFLAATERRAPAPAVNYRHLPPR